ncbi:MAG: hypothetical protein GY730_05640 [bacterium]|nr:hypothetical protein [bacterium]
MIDKKVKKYGFYKIKSDSRYIQRFICQRCRATGNNSTEYASDRVSGRNIKTKIWYRVDQPHFPSTLLWASRSRKVLSFLVLSSMFKDVDQLRT